MQINNGMPLKNYGRITVRLSKYFLLLFLVSSCSTSQKVRKDYSYPVSNPYPELFTTINYSDGELLKVNLEPTSLDFHCNKRSDAQPYYWCGLDGIFSKPVEGLPQRFEGIFHVQLPKWAVRNIRNLITSFKSGKHNLTIILHRDPQIDKKRKAFWNQMFAFYNKNSCVAFLGLEDELCPSGAKHIDIYLK